MMSKWDVPIVMPLLQSRAPGQQLVAECARDKALRLQQCCNTCLNSSIAGGAQGRSSVTRYEELWDKIASLPVQKRAAPRAWPSGQLVILCALQQDVLRLQVRVYERQVMQVGHRLEQLPPKGLNLQKRINKNDK